MTKTTATRLEILNRQVLTNIKFLIQRIQSYKAFCKITGINEKTVRVWTSTNPIANPTYLHLEKISNAFKISIHDLVKSNISKIKRGDLKAKYHIIQEFINQ